MTERIIIDSNGRKHITTETQLHTPQRKPLTDEHKDLARWNWVRNRFDKDLQFSRRESVLYALGIDDEEAFDGLDAIIDRAIEAAHGIKE